MIKCSRRVREHDAIRFDGKNEISMISFLNLKIKHIKINEKLKKTIITQDNIAIEEGTWVIRKNEQELIFMQDDLFKEFYKIEKYRNEKTKKDIIVGPRRSGKTTTLIKKAELEDLQIVTASYVQAKIINDTALDKGYKIKRPLSYDEFKRREQHMDFNKDGILIDEAINLLGHILNTPILGATIYKEGFE